MAHDSDIAITPGTNPGTGNWETQNYNYAGMRRPGVTAGPNAGGFQSFGSSDDGITAISHQLGRYYTGATTGKQLTTLNDIINTWAPSFENPTSSLIKRASKVMGVKPDDPLNLDDPAVMAKLIEAMIRNEQGGNLHPEAAAALNRVFPDANWSAYGSSSSQPSPAQAQNAPAAPTNQPTPQIVDMTKQAGFGDRFGALQPVQGMIIHHTAGRGTVDDVIHVFQQRGFPAQFVIDRDGTIYQTLPDGMQGQQIQTGHGVGEGLSNANTIGVEVIAKNNDDVTDKQVAAGQQLTNFLGQKYNFNPYTQVWGHGEVNPGHKEPDEGMKIVNAQRQAAPPPAQGGTAVAQQQQSLETPDDFRRAVLGGTAAQQAAAPAGQASPKGGSQPQPADAPLETPDQFRRAVLGAPPSQAAAPTSPPSSAAAVPTAPATIEGSPVVGASTAPTSPPSSAATIEGSPVVNAAVGADASPPGYTGPYATGDIPSAVSPGSASDTLAAKTAAAEASNALTAPQNWWLRSVKPVFDAADNPLLSPQSGVPLIDELEQGVGQGVRSVGTTLGNIDAWLTQNVPGYGVANRAIGYTPEKAQAQQDLLAAQTKAYEDKYKGNVPAAIGRLGGEMLATAPVGLPARGLGMLAEAIPGIGRIAGPALEWGTIGGAQNALTSGGTTPADWGQNFLTGGAGGALLGGGFSAIGPLLGRAATAVQQEARNLGFNLSLGETFGGLAKKIEGITSYFPFSGAATKADADRRVVNNILNRNMGMPETGVVNLDTMRAARANAGRLMDQISQVTVDGSRDQQFLNALGNIDRQAGLGNVTPINTLVGNIRTIMANHGGTLPGNELHNLVAQGGDLDMLIRTGTRAEKLYAQGVRTALQDAASRTADPALYPGATAATQQAVNDFNQGRYFWKTIKTVEPLVGKTGTADDATYAGLAARIRGTPANPNFDSRLQGPNNEMQSLARVLSGPLAELKSSGTGREIAMMRLLGLEGGGGVAGAALAGFLSPEHLVHAIITGVGLPLAVGQAGRLMRLGLSPGERLLMQRQVSPYVGNLLMGPAQQAAPNPAAVQ